MVGNTTGLKIHYIIIISILQRSSKLIEKNYESICDTNFKNRQLRIIQLIWRVYVIWPDPINQTEKEQWKFKFLNYSIYSITLNLMPKAYLIFYGF